MCIWLQFCYLCSFCRARKETKHWSVGKTAQRGQDVLLHYLLRQTHDSLYGLTHRKWVYCTSSFSLINIKHIDSMITSFYLSWSQSFWCDSFRRRRNFRHIDDDNKKHRSLKPNFLRSPPQVPSAPLLEVWLADGVEKLSSDQPLHFTPVLQIWDSTCSTPSLPALYPWQKDMLWVGVCLSGRVLAHHAQSSGFHPKHWGKPGVYFRNSSLNNNNHKHKFINNKHSYNHKKGPQ